MKFLVAIFPGNRKDKNLQNLSPNFRCIFHLSSLARLRQNFALGDYGHNKKRFTRTLFSLFPRVFLGVVLPHLLCEIFRANFSQFLSIFPRISGEFSQLSPDLLKLSQSQSILVGGGQTCNN